MPPTQEQLQNLLQDVYKELLSKQKLFYNSRELFQKWDFDKSCEVLGEIDLGEK